MRINSKLAIIIDDVGSDTSIYIEKLMTFPGKITLAVFAHRIPAENIMKKIISNSKHFQIILHQPMEPINYRERNISLSEDTIFVGDSENKIKSVLERNLNLLSCAEGVSNHMGSATTSDYSTMRTILQYIRLKNLFFIDSYTINNSVVMQTAHELGVPCIKNDVFLDDEDDLLYVQKQLNKLTDISLKKGLAIGIGHAMKKSTIDVLLNNWQTIEENGIEFIFADEAIRVENMIQQKAKN